MDEEPVGAVANIVSSTFEKFAQKDGSQTVHETHTDLAGITHDIVYTAGAGDNLANAMAAHAVDMGVNLELDEVRANISGVTSLGSLFSPTFVYSTVAENVAALRLAYLTASNFQAVMIGDFLSSLTNGQLQTAFGLTAGQVTTLRTNKLAPAATLAASIRATVGQ